MVGGRGWMVIGKPSMLEALSLVAAQTMQPTSALASDIAQEVKLLMLLIVCLT